MISPGSALYPLACDRINESFPLDLVTIIESGFATKSTATTERSITMVAAPTILFTGSQTITPLLVQSSEEGEWSRWNPTSTSGDTSPLESVVRLKITLSISYLNCRFFEIWLLLLTVK